MSDSKVYMFPESGASNGELLSILAPMLSQRGLDPNLLLAMNRNNGGFGGEGGWFMWVIFLFFLMGWGGNGFGFGNSGGFGGGNNFGFNPGNADLAALINNDNGKELLMSAIQGNGTAISQLASTLNCSIGNIQAAVNGVLSSVQNVGNQVGMSSQQVINAIQSGNCQLGNQLAQCCCSIQDAITRSSYDNQLATVNQTNVLQNAITSQGFNNQIETLNQTTTLSNAINNVATGQERGFSSVAYETQRQTCDIQNSIKDATAQILEGQRAAEMRELQNKVDALRELNSQKDVVINNNQQTGIFSQMIQAATAPLAGALNSLQGDVNGIKCKLPETVSVTYPNLTAIPSYLTNGWYGFNTFGSCGCNNSLWG